LVFDDYGNTPLMLACHGAHDDDRCEVVESLLDAVDTSQRAMYVYCKDKKGYTAMDYVCSSSRLASVLLDAGAAPSK